MRGGQCSTKPFMSQRCGQGVVASRERCCQSSETNVSPRAGRTRTKNV